MTISSTFHPVPAAIPAGRSPDRERSRMQRLIRGREDSPAWERPTLLGLLALTAVLYLIGLGDSGWANSFYSAAVQAGSQSWKAFFFGSSDAANSITVDKPPASLWLMALSVRVFGLSSWSILVPEALMGVATVGVLYATVRRHFSATTALFAGLLLAICPVAALMFRFDNPDALLVLVMTAAAYAVVRAIESGRTRWVVLAGALIGFGFLTKQLQVFLVLPGLAVAYLIAAPSSLRRRILDLLAGAAAIVAAAGWWVAIVELVPAGDRPYIGGSQHNSILELTFGYNGLGRITGDETGSVGGGGGPGGNSGGMWGQTGLTRMFGSEFGGQISWLLPAALILLIAGLAVTARARRTDLRRAALLLWGGWLVVTGLTFSLMSGIIHPYYAVALAPAVAAVVAIGVSVVRRWGRPGDLLLCAVVAVSVIWAFHLLARSPQWHPWLRWSILVVGLAAAAGLALATVAGTLSARRALAGVAIVAVLAGPFAYTLQTVSTPHTGSIVSAGPATTTGFGGPGGGGPGFGRAGGPPGTTAGQNGPGGGPVFGGNATNGNQNSTGGAPTPRGQNSTGGTTGFGPGANGRGGRNSTGGGGMGGLLSGSSPSTALISALLQNADSYTWVAATVGSNNASGYQLATGKPVMPIGGFNGSDPSPTLARFKADVAAGKIHYFIPGGGMGGRSMGGSNVSSQITSWVESHFSTSTIGGTTVYDLSGGSSS